MDAKRLFFLWYFKTNKKIIARARYSNYDSEEWCIKFFLKDKLDSMGIILDEFYIYYPQVETINQTWIDFSKEMEVNKVKVMIFTSPSAVRYFFSIMQNIVLNFNECFRNIEALISIGPNTTKELVSRKVFPVESKQHTIEGTLELAKRILSEK